MERNFCSLVIKNKTLILGELFGLGAHEYNDFDSGSELLTPVSIHSTNQQSWPWKSGRGLWTSLSYFDYSIIT